MSSPEESENEPEALLRHWFATAVTAADPTRGVVDNLPEHPPGRTLVVGAGKASARMAHALEQAWRGPLEGLVLTRHGYAEPCERIEIVEASHPVPDSTGEATSRRILAMAGELGEDDLLIALVSGGGSALLTVPADGLTLADKQQLTRALLRSGATIDEMNTVRKHLSAIKGGRLAVAAHPARTVALVVSDVPGDDPAVIASGPTVGETSTPADALDVLERYAVDVPDAVRRHLAASPGCPQPGAETLSRSTAVLVATPRQSLEAAAEAALDARVHTVILGDALVGEARDLATRLAERVRNYHGPRPCVLLSGGEVTVTVRGDGIGGPNAEFALALAIALDGAPGVYALAADTDGVDGGAEVAGAVVTPDTLARAAQQGLDPQAALDANDAHTFFAALGDQVITGPTFTNVNDFRAILIT